MFSLLSNYKEYVKFREELKKIKIEDAAELNAILSSHQMMEKQVIKKDNEIAQLKINHTNLLSTLENKTSNDKTSVKNNHTNELSKIKIEHENEILSLNQALEFEKKRLEMDTKMKIDEAKHELVLATKEFEKDRETMLVQVKSQVMKVREEYLEKNYGDLKENEKVTFDRGLNVVTTILDKLPFAQTNKQIITSSPTEVNDVEVKLS